MVLFNLFSKIRGSLKYKYDVSDSQWIDVENTISIVPMRFEKSSNVYSLDYNDAKCLDAFVANKK